MNTDPYACISFDKAFAALSKPGARMMMMHAKGGDAYFVIPGGRVSHKDAIRIMDRANVETFDDGLFPGHEQSWRIVTHDRPNRSWSPS